MGAVKNTDRILCLKFHAADYAPEINTRFVIIVRTISIVGVTTTFFGHIISEAVTKQQHTVQGFVVDRDNYRDYDWQQISQNAYATQGLVKYTNVTRTVLPEEKEGKKETACDIL